MQKWTFEIKTEIGGDGAVDHRGSLPPEGIPYKLYQSTATHVSLLNDEELVKLIQQVAMQD